MFYRGNRANVDDLYKKHEILKIIDILYTNLKFVVIYTNISKNSHQLVLTIYFNLIHKSDRAKREAPISYRYVICFLSKPSVVKQYHIAVLHIGMKYPLILNHLQPIKSLNMI